MRITIDESACIGAGACVMAAEEVFDQREEDGRAYLLVEQAPEDQHDLVHEAAETCPTGAITVED